MQRGTDEVLQLTQELAIYRVNGHVTLVIHCKLTYFGHWRLWPIFSMSCLEKVLVLHVAKLETLYD